MSEAALCAVCSTPLEPPVGRGRPRKACRGYCARQRANQGRRGRNNLSGRLSPDRERERAKRYGLTVPELHALYELANHACMVCGIKEADLTGKRRRLAIDHDHGCCPESAKSCGKCVRGLLCQRCNIFAVAYDLDLFEKLRSYVQAALA